MKSEIHHLNRISTNIWADSDATMKLFSNICKDELTKKIKGIQPYVQETSLNPFGMLMFSGYQVNKI